MNHPIHSYMQQLRGDVRHLQHAVTPTQNHAPASPRTTTELPPPHVLPEAPPTLSLSFHPTEQQPTAKPTRERSQRISAVLVLPSTPSREGDLERSDDTIQRVPLPTPIHPSKTPATTGSQTVLSLPTTAAATTSTTTTNEDDFPACLSCASSLSAPSWEDRESSTMISIMLGEKWSILSSRRHFRALVAMGVLLSLGLLSSIIVCAAKGGQQSVSNSSILANNNNATMAPTDMRDHDHPCQHPHGKGRHRHHGRHQGHHHSHHHDGHRHGGRRDIPEQNRHLRTERGPPPIRRSSQSIRERGCEEAPDEDIPKQEDPPPSQQMSDQSSSVQTQATTAEEQEQNDADDAPNISPKNKQEEENTFGSTTP